MSTLGHRPPRRRGAARAAGPRRHAASPAAARRPARRRCASSSPRPTRRWPTPTPPTTAGSARRPRAGGARGPRRPGSEALHLVQVVDRPGTDADEAVFRVVAEGGHGPREVRLGREGDRWIPQALSEAPARHPAPPVRVPHSMPGANDTRSSRRGFLAVGRARCSARSPGSASRSTGRATRPRPTRRRRGSRGRGPSRPTAPGAAPEDQLTLRHPGPPARRRGPRVLDPGAGRCAGTSCPTHRDQWHGEAVAARRSSPPAATSR